MTWLYAVGKACIKAYAKLFYRLKVYGLEHVESLQEGALIAANHCSFLDPPLIGVCHPGYNVHFLARDTLFTAPVVGYLLPHVHVHPVSRGGVNTAMLRTVEALVKEGQHVVIFPEGTRSENSTIQPFKAGLTLLVHRSQCAIIPCYLHGSAELWGRHRKWPKLWGRFVCVFGRPIPFATFAHLSSAEFKTAVTARAQEAVETLQHWYLNGAQGSPP